MKIAHLILVHSDPEQLERLIDRLQHENSYFFIHIDGKVNSEIFKRVLTKDRVFTVIERVKVKWGAYSIVQATINGFDSIIRADLGIEYINLLSGSDYPIKNINRFNEYLNIHAGQNFMEYYSVNEEWKEAITRLTEYHLTNYTFPGKYFIQKWLNRLLPIRKIPKGMVAVGRSQWFTITIDAAKYILDYLKTNPDVSAFFKLTWAPDEIIFHTILFNSVFKDEMVNNNLRYIDWSAGKASPKTLNFDDKNNLLDSSAFFARKFDMKTQGEILDYLDQHFYD